MRSFLGHLDALPLPLSAAFIRQSSLGSPRQTAMSAEADAQLRRELRDIVKLENQAEALSVECRFVRAAKRCAAAVERARALDALGENSVVLAQLQGNHAWMLLGLVEARLATKPLPATGNDMDTRAAAEQALELLLSAVSIIRFRRTAGTLLRGTCRAAEVAHALAEMDAMVAAGTLATEDASFTLAEEVGEFAAVKVAVNALLALGLCSQAPAQRLLSDAHLDSGALGVFAEHVLKTLDLVVALPSDGTAAAMINFAQRCEFVIGTVLERECARSRGVTARATPTQARAAGILVEHLKPLCDAWAAHRRTPALQRLLAPDFLSFAARSVSAEESERRSFVEGQRKRSCAHCGATEAVRGDFQACSRCRCAFYCSREHQRAHWRGGHKAACCDAAHSSQAAD